MHGGLEPMPQGGLRPDSRWGQWVSSRAAHSNHRSSPLTAATQRAVSSSSRPTRLHTTSTNRDFELRQGLSSGFYWFSKPPQTWEVPDDALEPDDLEVVLRGFDNTAIESQQDVHHTLPVEETLDHNISPSHVDWLCLMKKFNVVMGVSVDKLADDLDPGMFEFVSPQQCRAILRGSEGDDKAQSHRERECCLLVLNLVSSTLPCIRQPRPRLRVLDVCGFV